MPMYLIEEEGKKLGIAKAISSSAAISAATAGRFTATNIKTAEQFHDLIAEGVQMIAEPKSDPEGDTKGEGTGDEQQGEREPGADEGQDEQQTGTGELKDKADA